MKTWEILDAPDGAVINKIIAKEDFVAANFQYYREYVPPTPVTPPMFELSNVVIKVDGVPTTGTNGKFYLPPNALIELTATITGGSAIDAPVLKMVAERQVDDQPGGEEMYFNGSIVAGELSASGTFPLSSNFKFTADRNNRALDRMGAGFNISFETLDFLS